MKNLELYCEGLLDTDFGDDDSILTSEILDCFPDCDIEVSGTTLNIKPRAGAYATLLVNRDVRKFKTISITQPGGVEIFFTDNELSNFEIIAPKCNLTLLDFPEVIKNVNIVAQNVKISDVGPNPSYQNLCLKLHENGKLIYYHSNVSKVKWDASCRIDCGVLVITGMHKHSQVWKKIRKDLGYGTDYETSKTLEEMWDIPLMKTLGLNPKSWPNLRNIVITPEALDPNEGLEFFNRRKAGTTFGLIDPMFEFKDDWEGGHSTDLPDSVFRLRQ